MVGSGTVRLGTYEVETEPSRTITETGRGTYTVPAKIQRYWADFADSDRSKPTYIMAGTGSGKTELMKVLAQHEISHGHSLVIVDAHTEMCDEIAAWPESAKNGCILVRKDLFEGRRPIINPLQLPTGATDEHKELVASSLSAALGEILHPGGANESDRMVSILKTAIRILLDYENPTLETLRDVLVDDTPGEFLRRGQNHKDQRSTGWFMKEIWGSSDYRASRRAVLSRLVSLLQSKDFADLTCGPNSIPLYDLMAEGRSVLFSFGSCGSTAAERLGRIVAAMIVIAGEFRKGTKGEARPVHFFMDECQNFVNASTLKILDELRKYGFHATLASQSVTQLPGEVQDAILRNAGVLMMGQNGSATAALKRMRLKDGDTASLGTGRFLVAWGDKPTLKVSVRSEFVGNSHAMLKSQQIAWKMGLRRFYPPIEPISPPSISPEAPDADDRELD